MARKVTEKPHGPFEATIELANGGVARRCQARRKGGGQCRQPARRGFDVCHMHGAGSAKREREGTRQRPGRPIETGLYSKRKFEDLHEVMRQVEELERDLDNSDGELVVAKAALWQAVNLAPDAEAVRAQLQDALDANAFDDPTEVMSAARLVARLSSYVDRLQDVASKIVAMQRMRAQIQAATIDAKVKEQLMRDVLTIREVLQEYMDPETYAAAYQRISAHLKRSRGIQLDEPRHEA